MDDDLVIETIAGPPEKTFEQAVEDAMEQLADEAFAREVRGACPFGLIRCRCMGPAYCSPRRPFA